MQMYRVIPQTKRGNCLSYCIVYILMLLYGYHCFQENGVHLPAVVHV